MKRLHDRLKLGGKDKFLRNVFNIPLDNIDLIPIWVKVCFLVIFAWYMFEMIFIQQLACNEKGKE